MRTTAFILFILFTLSAFGGSLEPASAEGTKPEYKEKSYFIAVPLALFAGFGTGHFYAKDTWGGIRYIAYDLAGLGLGFLTLYFDDYSDRSIILAVAIATVNRIYQSVSAAEAVYYYNKNPLIRELDIFESERPGR
ncbi:MAG: hypothetical protein N3B13_12555, partial [Deltaproteobacteria bacterium]|nr:hypothetical protein [Deltaproteobacteria bacterium]